MLANITSLIATLIDVAVPGMFLAWQNKQNPVLIKACSTWKSNRVSSLVLLFHTSHFLLYWKTQQIENLSKLVFPHTVV